VTVGVVDDHADGVIEGGLFVEPIRANPRHTPVMKVMRMLLFVFLSGLAVSSFTPTAASAASASRPVTVRVILAQRRIVAGHSIRGTVVVTNRTATPITVATCAANGWLAVGLSGRVDSYPFAHTAIGCAPTVRLAPGANRFPVRVITTYAGCTQPEPAGGSPPTPSLPTCTVAGLPPLPAGSYTTKVDVVGVRVSQAPRVVVQLSAPTNPPRLAPCADQPGRSPAPVTVPDVVGASSLAAAGVFARACLNTGYASPVGSSVISETPSAGSTVPEHSTVTLTTR
jgi:PASTA domain